ncbi:MAG: carbonic anhydrase [Phycisphaerae bacterium]|nr:carbonic anhydrase [Gemmatimonadaceae bacterium]
MTQIIPVNYRSDILPEYRGTPTGLLLEYHNLERALGTGTGQQLLIGMCMDSRKALRIPTDFAYVLRTAGANMIDNEFRISFAIAVGNVRTIVLIAHTDCGMTRVAGLHDEFVRGLTEFAGWDVARAEKHFAESVPKFSMNDEIEFVMKESERLRGLYPKITVVPLLYRVEDDLLYQLKD